METASDVIVRNNYFRNVTRAIDYTGRAWPVYQMIVHDNFMDIKVNGDGILLNGSDSMTYTTLILRKNTIRYVSWDTDPSNTSLTGIQVSYVQDLVVQYNIINNTAPGNGVKALGVITHSTISNNINSSGDPV